MAEYRPDVPVLLITAGIPAAEPLSDRNDSKNPALDARHTSELLLRLRATMERMERARQQFRIARQSMRPLLEEGRRLRSEQSDLIAAVRTLAARQAPHPCPQCSSPRVAAMLYGSERLNRRDQLASGKVVLGGPHRSDRGPSWSCRDCDHRG